MDLAPTHGPPCWTVAPDFDGTLQGQVGQGRDWMEEPALTPVKSAFRVPPAVDWGGTGVTRRTTAPQARLPSYPRTEISGGPG